MFKIRKLVFSTILISLGFAWVLPSYAAADTADQGSSDQASSNNTTNAKNSEVVYNRLTNNFMATSKNKDAVTSTPNPWAAMLGTGVGVTPRYPGSETQLGKANLLFNLSYENRYFLNSTRGAGVNFINKGPLTLGASVLYNLGDKRGNEFPGLNNTKGAALGSFFANYTVSLWNFGLASYNTIGRLGGAGCYQANITRAISVTKRLVVNAIVNTQYDDGRYMQSLYGVTAPESVASGLPVYTTHRGWDNVSYGINPMYSINARWTLAGSLMATHYVDQVAASPVIQRKQTYVVGIGVLYNFFK